MCQIPAIIPAKEFETTDERVYVTTNEQEENETLLKLMDMDSRGEVFIGAGGLSALNLAAVRKNIKYIFLIDRSKLTQLFWKNMSAIIVQSNNKEECLDQIKTHLENSMILYVNEEKIPFLPSYKAALMRDLDFPVSWIFDDTRYRMIKTLFNKRHFTFLQLDFRDTVATEAMRKIFDKYHLKVDTLYLSNICHFIPFNDFGKYGQSLTHLLFDKTIIVDTEEAPFKTTRLLSRLFHSVGALFTHMRFPKQTGKNEIDLPVQRVRERNSQPVTALYPIIKLHAKEVGENLAYLHGLEQGYYTKEQEEKWTEKVAEEVRGITSSKGGKIECLEIVKITMDVAYTRYS